MQTRDDTTRTGIDMSTGGRMGLPVTVTPEGGGPSTVDALIETYDRKKADLERLLLQHGAVLFRGFSVQTPRAFRNLLSSIAGDPFDYVDGNSPRTKLARGVYTSTEYPPGYDISLHNELSYAHRWPSLLYFCCTTAAETGGETPIADGRAVLEALDPHIVERFSSRGVTYIRNLHGGEGYGPSWQTTFETSDRAEVESYCATARAEFTWREDGGLRVVETRPAVRSHPLTGEEVWFNQADQFHPSALAPDIYESMMALYAGREDELPQDVRFGDGSPIPADVLRTIRDTMKELSVNVAWQRGDVLMLDNMIVSHGRLPFTGPRRILASMC